MMAVIATVCVILAATGVIAWTVHAAEAKLQRAKISYEQLALVMRLEAEIGHLLLGEVSSIVYPARTMATGRPSDEAQHTITALIDLIAVELAELSQDEQARERDEYKTAYAIRALFNDMQHAIERERSRVSRLDSGSAVRDFMASVAPRFEQLNGIVKGVVEDERGEATEVIQGLAETRRSLVSISGFTILFAGALALAGATLTYRSIMRPLDALSEGSALLADGALGHRVSKDGPPELSRLAARFNDMADKLAAQQAALVAANEGLEVAVAERTRQLEEKARKLAEIDASRRLFFAKVSHELKTPLTTLMGDADIALQSATSSPGSYREALQHIAANGQYLKRRMSDLLALARSEDGRITLERQPCDLAELVRCSMAQAEAYARSCEVSLRFADTSCSSIKILADKHWLMQAFLALIDNAVKFSTRDADVVIAVARSEALATVTVQDDGVGVAERELRHIFDPFYQSASNRHKSGAGLGLSVARWVAEQHGGSIEAVNLHPRGFAITMRLQLA